MARQLLIFQRAVPVNQAQHRDVSLKSGFDRGFDNLARLAAAGELDLIYAHLHSQRHFTPTAERVPAVLATPAGVPEDAAA